MTVLWAHNSNPTRNEVVPGLWQGDWPYPGDLTEFHTIVSMTAEGTPPLQEARHDVTHLVLGIHDSEMDRPDEVRAMAAEVARRVAQGEKVLVHCAAGLNRSGVVVARALMFGGVSFYDAVMLVRRARGSYALSNPHFVRWLASEADQADLAALWG